MLATSMITQDEFLRLAEVIKPGSPYVPVLVDYPDDGMLDGQALPVVADPDERGRTWVARFATWTTPELRRVIMETMLHIPTWKAVEKAKFNNGGRKRRRASSAFPMTRRVVGPPIEEPLPEHVVDWACTLVDDGGNPIG
jgi:hypothetical protein